MRNYQVSQISDVSKYYLLVDILVKMKCIKWKVAKSKNLTCWWRFWWGWWSLQLVVVLWIRAGTESDCGIPPGKMKVKIMKIMKMMMLSDRSYLVIKLDLRNQIAEANPEKFSCHKNSCDFVLWKGPACDLSYEKGDYDKRWLLISWLSLNTVLTFSICWRPMNDGSSVDLLRNCQHIQ